MKRVLIVEDDADLVETYTDLLEANDYSVASTAKALDAIRLVPSCKPDIIILDLNLAGMSGTIVINIVRRYLVLKNTKIIVVTGHPEMLGKSDAERVDCVLRKPVGNSELLAAISQFAATTTVQKATHDV